MNALAPLNDAMAYLEANLLPGIDAARLSRIAGCSEYHFRRMFSFLSGMPLGEYIRRRKLSLAAVLLQTKGEKVIDVALALGYETPEAFSKAFRAMHGISPSEAKKANAPLKAFPPMTFQLTLKGGMDMEYRIVAKEAFQIVGFKKRITLQFKGVNPQMDALTQRLTPAIVSELKSLCGVEPRGILSVSANFSERMLEGSGLDQYMGVATTRPAPKGYDVLPVEASSWAVFSVAGAFPAALQETWGKIYAEWFPSSGYELTGGPEMLWNESPDTSLPAYRSEIWIPVRKLAPVKQSDNQ
ncbi:MAG: AraC family transcriptional regulator [Candidatus Limiplasma sp.]|nr:AraC family transcriptional regulator [Candidatus Limiplasma sp.]